MAEKKIVTGVRILSWIFIIGSLIEVSLALLNLADVDLGIYSATPQVLSFTVFIETVFIGILGLLGGIGTLKFFKWGRKVLIITSIIIIANLLTLPLQAGLAFKSFRGISPLMLLAYTYQGRFEILFYLFSIYYLALPSVKEQFR
jgi:hypothetical protein